MFFIRDSVQAYSPSMAPEAMRYNFTVAPIRHKSRILSIYIGIIIRCHIAAASPGFITNAPKFHAPGIFSTIFLSQQHHFTRFCTIDIVHPIHQILYSSTSYIGTNSMVLVILFFQQNSRTRGYQNYCSAFLPHP